MNDAAAADLRRALTLHVHGVVAVAEGQTPRLARVASIGVRVLPGVAATEIIATLGICAGLIALVVPGVLLLLRWSVAAQAAAVEREGWLLALRNSAKLTSGHYRHVFAVVVVTAVLIAAITLPVRAIPTRKHLGCGLGHARHRRTHCRGVLQCSPQPSCSLTFALAQSLRDRPRPLHFNARGTWTHSAHRTTRLAPAQAPPYTRRSPGTTPFLVPQAPRVRLKPRTPRRPPVTRLAVASSTQSGTAVSTRRQARPPRVTAQ